MKDQITGRIIDYLTDHIKADEVGLDRLYKISCDLTDIVSDIIETNSRKKP